jgi:aminoglycoside phosphotransferase (APT) family kinase protein
VTDTDLAGVLARDPALAALAAVLDPGQRRTVLGHDSTVTRIRYKPGSSIVAALTSPTRAGGWIAAYADPNKVTKTLSRAARAGFSASAVAGLPGVVVGETAADRMLSGPLAAIRSAAPELFAEATLLRHNPHRRAVFSSELAGAPVALKVSAVDAVGSSAASTQRDRLFDALEHAGVPVLRPSALPGVAGAETVPWWGDGDLAGIPLPAAAGTAGRTLARLHAAHRIPATPFEPAPPTAPAPGAEIAAAIRSMSTVLPGETGRAEALGARLLAAAGHSRAHRVTLVHGDFSPDQVLVGAGQVRLIDFDRCTLDAPERDLGSFLATAALMGRPELGSALLAGYAGAGGTVDDDLLHWHTATAYLLRAGEPFRGLVPDWAARTRAILADAESAAARC